MDIFINIIVMALSVVEYILFGRIFFLKKINKRISIKNIGILFIIGVIIMSGFWESQNWSIIMQILSTFIAIYCILDLSLFEAVKIWSIAFPMLMLLEYIPYVFYKVNLIRTGYPDIINISGIIVLMLLYSFITKKRSAEEIFIINGKMWIFISSELFILFILFISLTFPQLEEPNRNKLNIVLVVISIICILILNYLMFKNYNSKYAYRIEKDYLELFNKQQHDYFELLLSKEEETRSYRHDIRNELIQLKALLKNKRYEAADMFISEMNSDIDDIKKKNFSICNETADIMINYYLLPLKDSVKIEVNGVLGEELDISQKDLCIIVSNLLANAVEEIKKTASGERYIKITSYEGRTKASFRIENNMFQKVRANDSSGLPVSTKEDIKNHGFGLKNVNKVVEKNGGILVIITETKSFIAEVILNKRK